MIIYIFNEDIFISTNLPEIVNGMYPVYNGDQLIANISANGDLWSFEFSNDYYSNDGRKLKCELLPYKLNVLSPSNVPKSFNIVALPKYDKFVSLFDTFKEITIGNDIETCDICYPYNVNDTKQTLKLSLQNTSEWLIETNYPNFFVSGERAVTGGKIITGDYLFFYGLKIIFIGNKVIINNPNNQVKIASNGKLRLSSLDSKKLEAFKISAEDKIQKKDDPLFTKEDYFYKAPRFNYIIKEKNVKIDEPPTPPEQDTTSVALTIGPQLTMACTTLLSMSNFLFQYMDGKADNKRLIISIGTMVATLSGTLLWPNIARTIKKRKNKKEEKLRVEKYSKYLDEKKQEIENINKQQFQTLSENHPSAQDCLSIISEKRKELWQRNITDEDFLSVRVGTGTIDSKINLEFPEEKFSITEEDPLITKMRLVCENLLKIENAPIAYTFTNQIINAIVGEPELLKSFLDMLFLQILTFHSYTDLKIVVYTKEPTKWEYLKTAPHCWNNQKTLRYFSTNVEDLSTISSDLEKIFDARVKNDDEVRLEDNGENQADREGYKGYRPYYLFFIDDMSSIRNISLINKILHYKKNLGFSIIITSDNMSNLPSETKNFINITNDESVIMTSEMNSGDITFKADFNTNNAINLNVPVQKLANIPITIDKEKYEMPKSLSFLELYKVGRVEQLNSLSKWSDNNPVNTLSVPVGIDQNGEIFKMDIHEKFYGPHGLVAGTTGSGKSEWIITYILSLAVNFSPEEVQFVLIDYKGGGLAMSFENQELGIKLPHLAGTITNLDKSEIMRSISAIESELKRRQSVFNDAREKLKEGSMNIYKYQQFYRKGLVDEPMSHLLIICDEFAELKSQQPEFMDQLISTSRIGRSLGIHLILATQKPSGVVNEQIWSNSKFKVCLKVQDKSDSQEMLKKPDAAFLKQTGAFYLQVGNDDYYNLGQSAWAGAKYYPSDSIKKDIDESIDYIDSLGRTIESYGETEDEKEVKESQGEELLNVVQYISNISKQVSFTSRQLWLENIPSVVYFEDLLKKYNRQKPISFKYNIAIGEYDEPRKQMQGLLELDLEAGNIGIIGQGDPGTEKLLSTIIWSSVREHTPYEIAYYIIDFGSETMKKFAKLPHVGEVVFQDDLEKVASVLDLIIDELDRRKELLSDYNGSFTYYNKVSKTKLPLIVLVINEYDVFQETLPKLQDYITTLFRDAPKYGIIFIVVGNSQNSIKQRLLQYFNHYILMQLKDDQQYRGLSNCRRGLYPKKVVGRGICKTDSTSVDSYCEFQTASIADEDKELEIIKNYANKCVDYYKYKVKQIAKIPDDITSEQLVNYATSMSEVPIGIKFYEKEIAKYNFTKNKINIISSKKVSDEINDLFGIVSIISKIPNTKVRVVDFDGIFTKPLLDIKLFNDKYDVVIAALKKDAIERKETDPYAVNIIIGAGKFKTKLSKPGLEIFDELFNQYVKTAKQSTYILIDDYDKIRTLKLEPWYEMVDSTSGIWLGPEFDKQSLISSNEMTAEDKKLSYGGLAYIVEQNNYTIIKSVMDGDD